MDKLKVIQYPLSYRVLLTSFILIIFVLMYGIYTEGNSWLAARIIAWGLLLLGVVYHLKLIFYRIELDFKNSRVSLRNLFHYHIINRGEVSSWGIFTTYSGGRGSYPNLKILVFNMRSGKTVLFTLIPKFMMKDRKQLEDIFQTILSVAPKDYGFIGYSKGLKKYGPGFLFL